MQDTGLCDSLPLLITKRRGIVKRVSFLKTYNWLKSIFDECPLWKMKLSIMSPAVESLTLNKQSELVEEFEGNRQPGFRQTGSEPVCLQPADGQTWMWKIWRIVLLPEEWACMAANKAASRVNVDVRYTCNDCVRHKTDQSPCSTALQHIYWVLCCLPIP